MTDHRGRTLRERSLERQLAEWRSSHETVCNERDAAQAEARRFREQADEVERLNDRQAETIAALRERAESAEREKGEMALESVKARGELAQEGRVARTLLARAERAEERAATLERALRAVHALFNAPEGKEPTYADWGDAVKAVSAALAAPALESAGEEGSRATGRSPGHADCQSADFAEATPADPAPEAEPAEGGGGVQCGTCEMIRGKWASAGMIGPEPTCPDCRGGSET